MGARSVRLIWQIDPHDPLIWERDWLTRILEAYDVEHVVDLKHEVVADRAIVVTPGGRDTASYLRRFRAAGHAVGVIHTGDEYFRSPVSFYPDAAFVYRNHYRPETLRFPHCRSFALGYRSGFTRGLNIRDIAAREYVWAFAGQVKTSRAGMLRAAERIPGGHAHVSQGFGQGLEITAYADLLANAVFALCPRGNFAVDCFRVYEAFEAGAIPVVEEEGRTPLWRDLKRPPKFLRLHAWRPAYWSGNLPLAFRGSHWLAAYGEGFPCVRVRNWRDLRETLERVDVEATSRATRAWWTEYKRALARRLGEDVERHLLS